MPGRAGSTDGRARGGRAVRRRGGLRRVRRGRLRCGLWDLTAGGSERGGRARPQIDRSLGPVWEANHVWLIFVLVILWTGFPRAFAAIMTTLAVPFARGPGYGLPGRRLRVPQVVAHLGQARLHGAVFALASVVTPFFLGAIAGAVADGRVPLDGGDPLTSWTGPLSLVGGVLAVLTAFLAATLLAADAERRAMPSWPSGSGGGPCWPPASRASRPRRRHHHRDAGTPLAGGLHGRAAPLVVVAGGRRRHPRRPAGPPVGGPHRGDRRRGGGRDRVGRGAVPLGARRCREDRRGGRRRRRCACCWSSSPCGRHRRAGPGVAPPAGRSAPLEVGAPLSAGRRSTSCSARRIRGAPGRRRAPPGSSPTPAPACTGGTRAGSSPRAAGSPSAASGDGGVCTSSGRSARPMVGAAAYMACNGVRSVVPSEPWMCSASKEISRSTRAIVNLTAAISVRASASTSGRSSRPFQHEEAQHPQLGVGLGDLLLHHLVLGDDLAVRLTRQCPLAHHVEGQRALGDGAHRVVDAAAAESPLRQHPAAVFRPKQVVGRYPHVGVHDVVVVPGLGLDLHALRLAGR